jgi:hypothetical protein
LLLDKSEKRLSSEMTDEPVAKKPATIHSYFETKAPCAEFPDAYGNWIIGTYQSVNTCENYLFRQMVYAIIPKAPQLGKARVTNMFCLFFL